MSKLSAAITRSSKTAIRTYVTTATMIDSVEQASQYTDQVFYVLTPNKFYRKRSTNTASLTDYTEITLSSTLNSQIVPEWLGTNVYTPNDVIAHNGNLYRATTTTTAGASAPGTAAAANEWAIIAGATSAAVAPRVPLYDSTFTYGLDDIVSSGGRLFVSLAANNLGNSPTVKANGVYTETHWREYKRHFNKTADPVEVMRSMGMYYDVGLQMREITAADLTNLNNYAEDTAFFLMYDKFHKAFLWQKAYLTNASFNNI